MSIRVVNLRNYKLGENEVLIKVDRSSVLGNIYKMCDNSDKERNRVCDLYERYFDKKVKIKDSEFRNEVIRIYRMVRDGKDVALGCWCYPKRCHAEYVKKFIESYLGEPKGSSPVSKGENKMEFRDKYWFLSNFYPCKIHFGKLEFDCVEAAFQAAKCANVEDRKMFVGLKGVDAKRLGRKIKMRNDWSKVKDDVMFALVNEKFSNPKLAFDLICVQGDIVENNRWNDTYWGVCNGKGENRLGKILMKVRDSIDEEKNSSSCS